MKKYNVAVVGATGLVGRTFLEILEECAFPINGIKIFASERSVGKKVPFFSRELDVLPLCEREINGIDVAFFSAGGEVSGRYAPLFAAAGATVVDNSARWRMDEGVPLIVPEVNIEDYRGQKIVANPNCSTIQCVLPLYALKSYGIKRVNYCTYQAVSGSGQKGINALNHTLNGMNQTFYPHDISKTCIPEIGDFLPDGSTSEEQKMEDETKKILHLPSLKVSATCVRVPVKNCHAVSVAVEFEKEITADIARRELSKQRGVVVSDDPSARIYPVSDYADGKDEVFIGRIREDRSAENGLLFYCVADNVRRGAAYNAVGIITELIRLGRLRA